MEFVIFGLTLLGVALFHRHALAVAIAGLILTILSRGSRRKELPARRGSVNGEAWGARLL